MIAEQLGKLIKNGRARKGLKQEELAKQARVSRGVLSRLEQGNPSAVQSDTIDKLLGALGIAPQVVEHPDRDGPRKLARLQQELKLRQQRERHLRLAYKLEHDDPAAAAAMVTKANDRVELWRVNKSCSQFYVDRWSRLLALPPQQLAQEMFSLGAWEDALFQNSPWFRAWT
ncbi:MAG: helix-turn-helix domain-containing protein [Proteobacteria bacterium]|nr:helix-turn-helix domain-containing protein [Pseudomonadota bacterium]